MEYRNLTPFPSMAFDAMEVDSRMFHVAVLRMSLRAEHDGQLAFVENQPPLVLADEYYGRPNDSSVRQESDLAPYKPRCDVIVLGDAWAPGGKPAGRFEAQIKITRDGQTLLHRRLSVTGTRYWRKRFLLGWKLTKPEPVVSVPLRYEYAYGGDCRIETADPASRRVRKKDRLTPEQRKMHPDAATKSIVAHSSCASNTVGRGYAATWYLKANKIKRLPAPQIESVTDPIRIFGKPYAPQGVGIVARSWQPRLRLCGTTDEAFLQSGHELPADFDAAYWNGAPLEMQTEHLAGGDKIELTHLTPEGKWEFELPRHLVYALAFYKEGPILPQVCVLDTLILMPNEKQIALVWRTRIPIASALSRLEMRMIPAADVPAQNNLKNLIGALRG